MKGPIPIRPTSVSAPWTSTRWKFSWKIRRHFLITCCAKCRMCRRRNTLLNAGAISGRRLNILCRMDLFCCKKHENRVISVLKKNPRYFDAQNVYLETITVHHTESDQTAFDWYEVGKTQWHGDVALQSTRCRYCFTRDALIFIRIRNRVAITQHPAGQASVG